MKLRLFLGIAAIILWGPVRGHAQEPVDTGFVSIGGKLLLEGFRHAPGDDWRTTRTGYKGINYNYFLNESTPVSRSWETLFGQTLFLDIGVRPFENVSGDFGLEVIGDYADRFWLPVNYENRLKRDGKNISVNRADVRYRATDLDLQYFRGVGHYDWRYEGDLFGLFPVQYETEKYLRVSGRAIPEGFRGKLSLYAGTLDAVFGPEPAWDLRNAVYLNYTLDRFEGKYNLIYRDHVAAYGDPEERIRTLEVSARRETDKVKLHVGALFQPFRLNRDYVYVDEVAPGAGLLGTKYLRRTGTTSILDAFGLGGKVTFTPGTYIDDVTVKLSYRGLVAGNRQELQTQLNRRLSRSFLGSIEYLYRKPLLGPVPLVYEGTSGNPGPALLEPRGPESPFWVGWGIMPHSYDWDNRESSIMSVILTFDPTPGTWFYRYEPNVGEEWNLNPEENARLSFAARYTLAKYFSGTDRLTYWDENGKTVWEQPPLIGGAWPTKDYIGSFGLIGTALLPEWRFLFDLGFGNSLAFNSAAYTVSTEKEKPITSFFTATVGADTGATHARARYGKDIWGPEDWHRMFGQTFDELYQLQLSHDITPYLTGGIGYTGARERDRKYFAIELGDYDEFRLFFTLSFGPAKGYFGGEPAAVPSAGLPPETDRTPPEVSLVVSTPSFTPDGDGTGDTLAMELAVSDDSDIAEWRLTVADGKGRTVKTFEEKGQPPHFLEWNGEDDIYNRTVPEGTYAAQLFAADEAGNDGQSDPVEIAVSLPPKVVIKEVLKEVPKEVTVTETERGLLVSLTSRVLFDTGKSALRREAHRSLDEVVKILTAYQENKIAVEGHTDSVGSSSFNQRLSEERAWSVADYLIQSGIAAERIRVAGYGEDSPVDSNATKKGREANRRVEVIILKQ